MTPPTDPERMADDPDQTKAFDLPDIAESLPKQAIYYCHKCGSNRLQGLQPTTDTKNRWAIAARCLGCKRTRVIAVRD